MDVQLDELCRYIREIAALEENELDSDTALFSSGLFSSSELVDLVVFIEDTYEIKILPRDISLENLDSPSRIESLIQSKSG